MKLFCLCWCLQTARRLKSKPQDALEGVVLSVSKDLVFITQKLLVLNFSRSLSVSFSPLLAFPGRACAWHCHSNKEHEAEPRSVQEHPHVRPPRNRKNAVCQGTPEGSSQTRGGEGKAGFSLMMGGLCWAEAGNAFWDGLRHHDWWWCGADGPWRRHRHA